MSVKPLVRGLLRSPALAIAATLSAAVGVAATTAVATLANAVLLRPAPFPNADRLVRIWLEEPGVDPRIWLSIPESRELVELPVFDEAFATARVRVVAIHKDGAERLRGEAVDRGYFERLALSPTLGRLLVPDDHAPSSPPVVVIGYGLWTRAFGADPTVLGTTLRTQRGAYTIVGVAPRAFEGTVEDDLVEFWMPVEHYEPRSMISDLNARQTWLLGSLRPGAQLSDLDALLDGKTGEWRSRDGNRYPTLRLRAEPFGDSWRSGLRRGTAMLGGAAALLLLVAALNVSCLLLARVFDRSREFAVRRALGAERGRIVRQLVAEAIVMTAGGGLIGILVGPSILKWLLSIAPIALPSYLSVEADARVAMLSALVLAVTGLLAGTAPALAGSSDATADALQTGSRGVVGRRGERRWIPVLIGVEVAMTLVILVAGGLLLRSLDRYMTFHLGYARHGIARLAVTLSREDAGPEESTAALYARLAEGVASTPGVQSAGLVSPTLPPWDPQRGRILFPEVVPATAASDGLPAGVHLADAGLFPTLGIPITAGRNFHPGESEDVAIVSRGLAARLGGEQRAIGRTITVRGERVNDPEGTFRVVGVAGDVAYDGFAEQDTRRTIRYMDDADPRAGRWDVYLPLARFRVTQLSIAAAAPGNEAAALDGVRRTLGRLVPSSAVHWTSTMDDEVAVEYAPARFYSAILATFAVSALLLTCIGLFALLWHSAATRMGEMGLRLALGASPRRLAWLIVSSASRPLLAGAGCGLLVALWVGDWLRGFLYGIPPADFVTLAGATFVVLLAALAAALLPARRAAAADPLGVLKSE